MKSIVIFSGLLLLLTGCGNSDCSPRIFTKAEILACKEKSKKGSIKNKIGMTITMDTEAYKEIFSTAGIKRKAPNSVTYFSNNQSTCDPDQIVLLLEGYKEVNSSSIATSMTIAFDKEEDFNLQKKILDDFGFYRKSTPLKRSASLFSNLINASGLNIEIDGNNKLGDVTLYSIEPGKDYLEASAFSVTKDNLGENDQFWSDEKYFIVIGFFQQVN